MSTAPVEILLELFGSGIELARKGHLAGYIDSSLVTGPQLVGANYMGALRLGGLPATLLLETPLRSQAEAGRGQDGQSDGKGGVIGKDILVGGRVDTHIVCKEPESGRLRVLCVAPEQDAAASKPMLQGEFLQVPGPCTDCYKKENSSRSLGPALQEEAEFLQA